MRFFDLMQNIDRRFLYVLLAVTISIPFVFATPVPPAAVLPQARGFYETFEAQARDPVRKNKIVIVSTNFSASTRAENLTQTETILRHLMKLRLPFAIFCYNDPQGRELAQQVAERLDDQYDYRYGRDYVNWGYKAGTPEVLLSTMVRNIPDFIRQDINGTPFRQIPVCANVQGANDVGTIVEIASADTLKHWIRFFQRAGDRPIPTLFSCTAVMAPEAFPYLKSGQLQGMLIGLKGAIEYEGLIKEAGFATRASASLSYAHFLILGLIALGNLGMLVERARKAKGAP